MNGEKQIEELAKTIQRTGMLDSLAKCNFLARELYRQGYCAKHEIVDDIHIRLERMRPLRTFPRIGERKYCNSYDLGRDDAISEAIRCIFDLENKEKLL